MKALKKDTRILGRLKARPDFLYVKKHGQKWVSKGFVLQTAQQPADPDNTLPPLRYGLTVSRRAHRSAVKRNRIKRRLRSLAKDILPGRAERGRDYVLIGRTAALKRPYDALKRDCLWCLENMSCLKD